MNYDTLRQLIRQSKLAEHEKFIMDIAKPAVYISFAEKEITVGGSRFGGLPDVPSGFQWPRHQFGPFRFLGQINFREVPTSMDHMNRLPNSGLLSLFVADDPEEEFEEQYFWQDEGYTLAFYHADEAQLAPMDSPEMSQPVTCIEFSPGIDLPFDTVLRSDWPFSEEQLDFYCYEFSRKIRPTADYLLGYPSFNTLGYDPTPGAGWISLLTLHSDDDLHWCWHDDDKLMIFIEQNKLARRDFSALKSDAG